MLKAALAPDRISSSAVRFSTQPQLSVSKDIAEGFVRNSPAEFARFLDYALGSLAEAKGRVQDGVDFEYFPASDCETAFRLVKRCYKATLRLKQSQDRYLDRKREERKNRTKGKDDKNQPPRT